MIFVALAYRGGFDTKPAWSPKIKNKGQLTFLKKQELGFRSRSDAHSNAQRFHPHCKDYSGKKAFLS